jgi:hypothetical protein
MANPKRTTMPAPDDAFNDAAFVAAAAMRAFTKAAKAAVAENDRLGIITHGAVDGRLVERKPPAVLKPLADQK